LHNRPKHSSASDDLFSKYGIRWNTPLILANKERSFLSLITFLFILAAIVSPYPQIAMWVGFAIAGYSAIANDSIQTIGTFIASNMHRKWWVLWLYIGGIFLATVTYSWISFDGDVSYQRLTSKGFAEAPSSFTFLQVAAPIFLLLLTRLRMPVSTTFLILSCFASDSGAIASVLNKSLSAYVLAFFVAFAVFISIHTLTVKLFKDKKAHPIWMPIQWLTSGSLWGVWIMQDAANIAVYLPRSLQVGEFLAFALFIFCGLGLLFYLRGDRIQSIVTEKTNITDVRSATIVDFIYAMLLLYKLTVSTIPMSTTWVFIGLLAGRELAMNLWGHFKYGDGDLKTTFKIIGRDLLYAGIGLIVSLVLAISINPVIREELLSYF
jgi:hypothetical protein